MTKLHGNHGKIVYRLWSSCISSIENLTGTSLSSPCQLGLEVVLRHLSLSSYKKLHYTVIYYCKILLRNTHLQSSSCEGFQWVVGEKTIGSVYHKWPLTDLWLLDLIIRVFKKAKLDKQQKMLLSLRFILRHTVLKYMIVVVCALE